MSKSDQMVSYGIIKLNESNITVFGHFEGENSYKTYQFRVKYGNLQL